MVLLVVILCYCCCGDSVGGDGDVVLMDVFVLLLLVFCWVHGLLQLQLAGFRLVTNGILHLCHYVALHPHCLLIVPFMFCKYYIYIYIYIYPKTSP